MEQKVRKGEELNEINLKKFLKENDLISDIKSELNVLQFSNGFSNLTYSLAIENKEYVIRKPPKGAVYGHDMNREFKVLKGAHNRFDTIITDIQEIKKEINDSNRKRDKQDSNKS